LSRGGTIPSDTPHRTQEIDVDKKAKTPKKPKQNKTKGATK
jgi:hypothetical protein